MMEKFAEDERIEQMNAQKRRMKQLEHRRAVDELVTIKQELNAKAKEQDRLLNEKEVEMEKYKNEIVEQERQKMLREHAQHLIGHLPHVFNYNKRGYLKIKKICHYLMKNLERNSSLQ